MVILQGIKDASGWIRDINNTEMLRESMNNITITNYDQFIDVCTFL